MLIWKQSNPMGRRYSDVDRVTRLTLESLEDRLCLSAVAYWRFEEGIPNVPATGANSILDSSGDNFRGTPVNGPVYRSDVKDNPIPQTGQGNHLSIEFNNPDQGIFVPDSPAFQLTQSLTVEAYINLSSYPGPPFGQILFRGDDRFALDPYFLAVSNHDLVFHIENSLGQIASVSSPVPALHQWLHVAGTLDNATGALNLYINGALVSSATTTIRPFGMLDPNFHPGLGIGSLQSPNDGTQTFPGFIDEVRISDEALHSAQFLDAPARAVAFQVDAPAKVFPGMPFDVTVTALNAYGRIATGYTGTVTFSTSDPDPGAVLPADYTFTTVDAGVHTFTNTGVGESTLLTHGHQTITVTDTADGSLVGSITIKVKRTRDGDVLGRSIAPGQTGGAEVHSFAFLLAEDISYLPTQSKRRLLAEIELWGLD